MTGIRHVDLIDIGSLPEMLSFLSREWDLPLQFFEPVSVGMSTSSVFLIRGVADTACYLKIERENATAMRAEIQRTRWLAAHGIGVPSILKTFDNADMAAELMTELPGCAPQNCGRPRRDILDILAKGMKEIHSLPLCDCPFDETTPARLRRAYEAIQRRTVDAEQFEERNRGLTPDELYQRLLAAMPEDSELVLIHGDADFDNLRIDSNGRLGFLDCGASGQGDRYVDLVCITTCIENHFGAEWISGFLDAYGLGTWDDHRARFFSDLYEFF
jgi:aminoglycoside 3'-phosphotransferase II